jgi:peptidoglycan/xylan/chitin deacetylase (PgdA/CDA1 family)
MWAVIPNDISEMNAANLTFLKSYFKAVGTAYVGQHGYSHLDNGDDSEFYGLPYETQYERILKGRLILENAFGQRPVVFVPPFDKADRTTTRALKDLGFEVYSSNSWETIDLSGLTRFDTTIDAVDSWKKPATKSITQLDKEYDYLQSYRDYIVITIHHYTLGDDGLSVVEELIGHIKAKGGAFTTFRSANSWYDYRNMAEFSFDGASIEMNAPDSQLSENLTISFSVGGNYGYAGNISRFNIMNRYSSPISVCLDNGKKKECKGLSPGETGIIDLS